MYNVILPKHDLNQIFVEPAVALFHALRRLGADPLYHITNELPRNGRQNIVLAAQLWPTDLKDQIIWNFESAGCDDRLKGKYGQTLRQNRVMDWSRENTKRLKDIEGIDAVCLPMGYVPELTVFAPKPVEQCEIDVLFFGSMNERRQKVIDALRENGLRVHSEFMVFGDKRKELTRNSKIVLNVKFHENFCTETVRLIMCMANGCAVLNENKYPDEDQRNLLGGVAFSPYEEMADAINGDWASFTELRLTAMQTVVKQDMVDFVREVMK